MVLYNSAKIRPRQHILALPVSDMSGSYWVRVSYKGQLNTAAIYGDFLLQIPQDPKGWPVLSLQSIIILSSNANYRIIGAGFCENLS